MNPLDTPPGDSPPPRLAQPPRRRLLQFGTAWMSGATGLAMPVLGGCGGGGDDSAAPSSAPVNCQVDP